MSGSVTTCFLLLTLGADPLNEAAKKELKKLEGEWIVVSVETSEGKQDADDELVAIKFVGSKVTMLEQNGEIVALDAGANPKTLDIKSKVRGKEERVAEMIYKIEAETLVIVSYQGKDKNRPTSFDKPTDGKIQILTCTRAKK